MATMIHFLTTDSQYELHENSENSGAPGDFLPFFTLYSLVFFKVKQKMGGVGKGFGLCRLRCAKHDGHAWSGARLCEKIHELH